MSILFSILGDARKCYSCDTVQDPNKDCNDAANYKEDECLSNDSSCSKVVQNGSKLDTISSNETQNIIIVNMLTYLIPLKFTILEVTRGCSNLVKTTKCQKNDATELCYCNGDYCNSARSLQSYPKYFASIILIPLLQFLLSQYKNRPVSGEKLL